MECKYSRIPFRQNAMRKQHYNDGVFFANHTFQLCLSPQELNYNSLIKTKICIELQADNYKNELNCSLEIYFFFIALNLFLRHFRILTINLLTYILHRISFRYIFFTFYLFII